MTIATLHEKSGSAASLREFRRQVKALAQSGKLPGYRMVFDSETDAITFYAMGEKGGKARMGDLLNQLKR